jgi:hypothetical protein
VIQQRRAGQGSRLTVPETSVSRRNNLQRSQRKRNWPYGQFARGGVAGRSPFWRDAAASRSALCGLSPSGPTVSASLDAAHIGVVRRPARVGAPSSVEAPPPIRAGESRLATMQLAKALKALLDHADSALKLALLALILAVAFTSVRDSLNPIIVINTPLVQGAKEMPPSPDKLGVDIIERVAEFTSRQQLSWRTSSLAPMWSDNDVAIPNTGITVAGLAKMLKAVWGTADVNVLPEFTWDGKHYDARRLRVSDQRQGWISLQLPADDEISAGQGDGKRLDWLIRELVFQLDPLALASYDFVHDVEPKTIRRGAPPHSAPVCNMHVSGAIVDSIQRCIATCSSKNAALAYILWGDLLTKASDLRGQDGALLQEAGERYQLAERIYRPSATLYTHWGRSLWKLGRRAEAETKYQWAIDYFLLDARGHYDLADQLSDPYRIADMDGLTPSKQDAQDLEAAYSHYQLASLIDPGNGGILTRLGQARLLLSRPESAKPLFWRAIELNGSDAAAYRGLCMVSRREGAPLGDSNRACDRANVLDGYLDSKHESEQMAPCPKSWSISSDPIVGR